MQILQMLISLGVLVCFIIVLIKTVSARWSSPWDHLRYLDVHLALGEFGEGRH